MELLEYVKDGGRTPFEVWLKRLDQTTRARVRTRLNRLRLGYLGDCKSIRGGVLELRLDFGPGYRVYLVRIYSDQLGILCGGDKQTQKKDIQTAQRYWKDYQEKANASK